MGDWRIHRHDATCARCERAFEEEETLFSTLSLDEDGLRREDLCKACFQDPGEAGEAAEPRRKGEFLFWRTRHVVDRKARFAVDFEAIEELFLTLEGRREERLAELRYLLSLLLLRKKRLKLVGVRRTGGTEVLCLRRPRRQEEFVVPVFELDTERAVALQADLARVFDGAGVEALAAPREDAPEGDEEGSEEAPDADEGAPEPGDAVAPTATRGV